MWRSKEVAGHIAGNGCFAGANEAQILLALLRGDLVADVEQLPQARIEILALRIVAQRGDILRGAPLGDHGCRREFPGINVNHRRIGRAEFVHVRQRLGVNLLGQGQSVAARFGQADDFLEPGGAGGLEMQPGVGFLKARRIGA